MRIISPLNSVASAIARTHLAKPQIKFLPLALALLPLQVLPAHAMPMEKYQDSCAACHDSGTFNAPRTGDKATWSRLLQQKGMNGLVQSVHQGMPQMPAGGLCNDCTDAELQQMIEHMSQ